MEGKKSEIIKKTVFSFKDTNFNMTDIFLRIGLVEQRYHLGITYEDVCSTVDELSENGLLNYAEINDGTGRWCFSLSELAFSQSSEIKR